MTNDFLTSFSGYPKKANANVDKMPSYSAVPDHAYALATKPSVSDLELILKKRDRLEKQIADFEILIKKIALSPFEGSGIDQACTIPKYMMYCDNGTFKTDTNSLFFKNYLQYLEDKKDHRETFILAEYSYILQELYNNRQELVKLKNEVTKTEKAIKESNKTKNASGASWNTAWQDLKTRFVKNNFKGEASLLGEDINSGQLAVIAGLMSAEHAYAKVSKKIQNLIENIDPNAVEKSKKCAPQPKKLGQETGQMPAPPDVITPETNCGDIILATPNNFGELSKMIPYYPEKKDFTFSGRKSTTKTKVHLVDGYKTKNFRYPARGAGNQIINKDSPPVWACLASKLETSWAIACATSKYYPFEIFVGTRGSQKPNLPGTTAYRTGVSLHSFGLAIDVDPFITGYSGRTKALNSIYTGAWTPGFIDKHGLELWKLGVFYHGPSTLKNNAYQADNVPRMAENWKDAPSHYRGSGESGGARKKYTNIMNKSKGTIIVPPGANPVLWVLTFCEGSGMRWGNGMFLKKRHRGGKTWSSKEKDQIADIYKIPNIVDRIQAISWKSSIEDHMHFHYWGGSSLVPFKEINKVKNELEKK